MCYRDTKYTMQMIRYHKKYLLFDVNKSKIRTKKQQYMTMSGDKKRSITMLIERLCPSDHE